MIKYEIDMAQTGEALLKNVTIWNVEAFDD